MKKYVMAAIVCLMIPGMAHANKAEREARRQHMDDAIADFKANPITCSEEADCKAKWEMTQVWIAQNSDYKIQTATDILIQTYSAPAESGDIGVKALKAPLGNGKYILGIDVWCGRELERCYKDTGLLTSQWIALMRAIKP